MHYVCMLSMSILPILTSMAVYIYVRLYLSERGVLLEIIRVHLLGLGCLLYNQEVLYCRLWVLWWSQGTEIVKRVWVCVRLGYPAILRMFCHTMKTSFERNYLILYIITDHKILHLYLIKEYINKSVNQFISKLSIKIIK